MAKYLGQHDYDTNVIRGKDLNKLYTLRATLTESVIAETLSIDTKSLTSLDAMSESYTLDQKWTTRGNAWNIQMSQTACQCTTNCNSQCPCQVYSDVQAMGVCSEACSCLPGSQCKLLTTPKMTIMGEVKGKGKVLIANQDIKKGERTMEFVGEIVAQALMRLDRCTKYRTTVYGDYLTSEEIEQLSEIVEFDLAPAFRVQKK